MRRVVDTSKRISDSRLRLTVPIKALSSTGAGPFHRSSIGHSGRSRTIMRARSWMAALALIAGTSIAVGRAMPASSPTEDQGQEQPQQDDRPAAKSQTTDAKPADKPIKAVLLNLEIAGLSPEGCDVEVK